MSLKATDDWLFLSSVTGLLETFGNDKTHLYFSSTLAHTWSLSTLNVSKKTKELNFNNSFQFEFSATTCGDRQ